MSDDEIVCHLCNGTGIIERYSVNTEECQCVEDEEDD